MSVVLLGFVVLVGWGFVTMGGVGFWLGRVDALFLSGVLGGVGVTVWFCSLPFAGFVLVVFVSS